MNQLNPDTAFLVLVLVQVGMGIMQILLGLAAWLGKRTLDRIEESQGQIVREVQITNGAVIRVEQKIIDHDRLDEQRFDELEKRLDREERRR